MSDEESILGATNRAKAALAQHADAAFGVGMEGGLHKLSDRWYECGWIAVVDKAGKVGLGSSARFECSKKIVDEILKGKELADVIDELTGLQDVRSSQGAMVR
jgi:inosine/xanthosine triphosphatase